jgi:hypothetical protein
MLFPPIDPNERFRQRRNATRRRQRQRRSALIGLLLVGLALAGLGAQFVGGGTGGSTATPGDKALPTAASSVRPLPVEIRGVHVTMGLASIAGKLEEYVDLADEGLTAIELDVKDEDGQIGFDASSVRLAKKVGATESFYSAREAARLVHSKGLYLIGRVVVFEDPILSHARPELAVRRSDGSVWQDSAGLGWTNPYDKRVWNYNIAVAAAAARNGFDEIMFDYVRFPSDGDVENAVSAARDMGIGQIPRRIAKHVHAMYTMTYPSLFGAGELGLADPGAAPGATVSRALKRFQRALEGRNALLLPWVQDFSFTVPYGKDEVRAQIYSARIAGAKGYLLWNARGEYTSGTLTPP